MGIMLAVSYVLNLRGFSNEALLDLNMALVGLGSVPKTCAAYKPALQAGLISEAGNPRELESLEQAVRIVIDERTAAGTLR